MPRRPTTCTPHLAQRCVVLDEQRQPQRQQLALQRLEAHVTRDQHERPVILHCILATGCCCLRLLLLLQLLLDSERLVWNARMLLLLLLACARRNTQW
jgi:hypothetical protein